MTAPLQGPAGTEVCPPAWLALREPADADARSADLAASVPVAQAGSSGALLVRDLGCGTGSMARWLAPRLHPRGGQHWVLHDRDPGLLEYAVAGLPAGVTGAAAPGDLTRIDAAALAGTGLVVASALLDLLDAGEVDALADACDTAGCPALLTLSVTGRVRLDPPDPLDPAIAAAFDDHQRRRVGARRLLGPDAVPAAVTAFGRRGARVRTAPSPWRLGPDRAGLLREWLAGWLDAACTHRPGLRDLVGPYRERREDELARGRLTVRVGHADLLAVPDPGIAAGERP